MTLAEETEVTDAIKGSRYRTTPMAVREILGVVRTIISRREMRHEELHNASDKMISDHRRWLRALPPLELFQPQ